MTRCEPRTASRASSSVVRRADRVQQPFASRCSSSRPARAAVLGRDVLVAERLRLLLGPVEDRFSSRDIVGCASLCFGYLRSRARPARAAAVTLTPSFCRTGTTISRPARGARRAGGGRRRAGCRYDGRCSPLRSRPRRPSRDFFWIDHGGRGSNVGASHRAKVADFDRATRCRKPSHCHTAAQKENRAEERKPSARRLALVDTGLLAVKDPGRVHQLTVDDELNDVGPGGSLAAVILTPYRSQNACVVPALQPDGWRAVTRSSSWRHSTSNSRTVRGEPESPLAAPGCSGSAR